MSKSYEDVWLSVNDLTVDPRVQRYSFNPRKVERIVANFNEDAFGIITASRRDPVTISVIDGWHRWEAKRRLTDSTGTIYVRVFEGLTLAEEAQMFLDLNPGNQPTALDRYRMRLIIEEPTVMAIDKAVHSYGWAVNPMPAPGHLQCVKALERIQVLAEKSESTEDLLSNVMLVVSRAWGNKREAGAAILLEGMAHFLLEYRHLARFDQDRLIQVLRDEHSDPFVLTQDAQQYARVSKMRAPMAVADSLVKAYNRGLKVGGPKELSPWRRVR